MSDELNELYPDISRYLYSLWRATDDLCTSMGWEWSKETYGPDSGEIRARPKQAEFAYCIALINQGQLIITNPEKFVSDLSGVTVLQVRLFFSSLSDGVMDILTWDSDKREFWNMEFENLIDNIPVKPAGGLGLQKGKQGPRRWTMQEKIEAVKTWDNLDRDYHAITLEQFLEEKFGATGGTLHVAVSTFHGWRRYLKNS